MDDGAVAIAGAVINSKLEVLELMENQIGTVGFGALASVLPQTKLTELALLGNEFNADDVHLVFQLLPRCGLKRWSEDRSLSYTTQSSLIENLPKAQLIYLDLNISPIMLPSFLAAAATSSLERVVFRSNDGDSICVKLADNIHNLTLNEVVFLSYTHMNSKSIGILFEALQRNKTLTKIELPGKIGNDGVKEISKYFNNTCIDHLSIVEGDLDDDSFDAFMDILRWRRLKYLDITDNQFGELVKYKFKQASSLYDFHLLV
ncbi:hypothetical protein HDV01_006665 [Terramyces sp. JEL0728]|nr:hypothetical protein HDV01_006665 [Terramyces sp. JEL0728]